MNPDKSLQAIKTELAKKEAALKSIRKKHPHLAYLSEAEILAYFQVTSIDALNKHIKQIENASLYHTDHLISDNTICRCTDSRGELKTLYETQTLAQEEIDQLKVQKLPKLRVYACPSGHGWHLTKG